VSAGKDRRLRRILHGSPPRTVIVPVDDSLIAGPSGGLRNMRRLLESVDAAGPDAILGFPRQLETYKGVLKRHDTSLIGNLTASTTRSHHTDKYLVSTIKDALRAGCDAVAAHVNISSRYEKNMLQILAGMVTEADQYGIPVVAIVYPRREGENGQDDNYDDLKESDCEEYAALVAHCVRIAVDLGASVVKTQHTGDVSSLRTVIEAASPVPVVFAGGPLRTVEQTRAMAVDSIRAGGSGVSFGRNVFHRRDPSAMIADLMSTVHGNADTHD
jgi:DhnA family fructose-bisphosphate aldolase class Ia